MYMGQRVFLHICRATKSKSSRALQTAEVVTSSGQLSCGAEDGEPGAGLPSHASGDRVCHMLVTVASDHLAS